MSLDANEIDELLREVIADERQRAEVLAKHFHDRYEKYAPMFGYETREETREFDPESPNGKLMVFVFQEFISLLRRERRPYEAALRVMQYKQRHGLAITNSTGSLKRWLDELKRVAVRYFEFAPTTTFDEVAWKVYYDDGLIPWDALVTDMAEAK